MNNTLPIAHVFESQNIWLRRERRRQPLFVDRKDWLSTAWPSEIFGREDGVASDGQSVMCRPPASNVAVYINWR
jgi:hypothetical protein